MIDKQKPKVIAIVGMPGSGKSTCADFFKDKGYQEIYFGGIVVETVKNEGKEVNETNEREVRERLRAEEGMGVMAARSVPKIDETIKIGKPIIIDDMYSFSEYRLLKKKYGDDLFVIAVVTPRQIRHDRLKDRQTRPLNEEEATSRDYAQIENLEIGGSISIADEYILNSGSLEELERQFNKLIEKIS